MKAGSGTAVSVFSDESWWGEPKLIRVTPQALYVSVFSDESWWGEQKEQTRQFHQQPLFQYSLTNLGGVNRPHS